MALTKTAVILVTGASSGIGEATVKRFAKEGYLVVAGARRLDKLQALEKQFPGRIMPFVLDVTKRKDVEEAVKKIQKEIGPIDVLINNAGLALGLDPAHKANIEDWDHVVDVNIKGLLYCTKAVLPSMVERNQGYIINIGSVAGTYPYPGGNVYGATKAFVHQFSLNLKADLLGTNVRVTCIEPGLVETEFSLVRYHGDQQKARSVYEDAEALLPDDIAELIYTCATQKSHVNINTIEVMPVCQASGKFEINRNKH
ncbi:MAG: SDR family oxidoreductase [Chlamydiae bacterium]|nr:SDR family oxidoreductase [Chlamydiota bacterium]